MPRTAQHFIAVAGLKNALRDLEQLGPAGRKELRSRLKHFADLAARGAKNKVEVSDKAPHLRDTIRSVVTKSGAAIRAGNKTRAPQAGVLHFGRRALVRAHMRGGASVSQYIRKLTPKPYLFPEVDRVARNMNGDISAAIQSVIEKGFR